ncbi:fungal transcriptional regulatory protein [Niveomyces insectorum RCEF 264]|uniref:Fungal transcriptional regulatory protein n=1 Tax=Niveomyces insectorum RCEF 264 TaxID=1081102 RepID=A0A168A744_9HYPO|nr:fungal transcriptional regulatory protein [Niveomyces insectorum RCEF 264]
MPPPAISTALPGGRRSPERSPETRPVAVQYSCLRCKQRKVRCDRHLPCSACVGMGVECVPRTRAPYSQRKRQRRSDILERQPSSPPPPSPLRPSSARLASRVPRLEEEDEQSNVTARPKTGAPIFGQNLWTGLQDEFSEPQVVETPATASEQPAQSVSTTPRADPSSLIFANSVLPSVALDKAHPQPVHTFVLWQTFLQNVNPLSKIVYAPQVQDLVVQAAGGFASLSPQNTALLFAIYAAAVASLLKEECQTRLGEPKQVLLERYLACTQQALVAAGFLQSTNLTLLQALAIFLLAARQSYEPNVMWILTGMALRMGQRLLATATNTTTSGSEFFETQMRLRVWWQILLIDGRATQLSGQTMPFSADLSGHRHPLPAHLNDSDIHPNMTAVPPALPADQRRPTEMLFCLSRYELGQFLFAHSTTLHDPTASVAVRDALIDDLAATFHDKYLRFLDPAIPLHQIAASGMRAGLAKLRLMVHHPAQYADKGRSLPQAEHDMLFATSIDMVDLLAQGLTSTHLRHFQWHIDVYFQLDVVVFMLIESQRQPPTGALVDKAWQLAADVLRYRPGLLHGTDELSVAVRQLTLRAWEVRERKARQQKLAATVPAPPDVIATLRAEARHKGARPADETNVAVVAEGGTSGATQNAAVTGQDEAAASGTAPNMDFEYPMAPLPIDAIQGEPSSLASYADLDILGWETTDWESWDYWNTLLQSQAP